MKLTYHHTSMVFFFGSPLASCSSSTMSLSSSSSYWSRISELLAAGSVFLPLHIALACLLAGWCDDSAMLRVTDSAFRYAKFPMSNIRLLLRQCMPYLMLAALILNNYRLSETSGSSDHLHWRNHRQTRANCKHKPPFRSTSAYRRMSK